jgi:hypothetical protein
MMKAEQRSCASDPVELKVNRRRLFRRMFYGAVFGSIIAYGILAVIQPDLFWAIFNPRKVSTVTQGMLSRSFYILAMSLVSLFIGGIPGAVVALFSRRLSTNNSTLNDNNRVHSDAPKGGA